MRVLEDHACSLKLHNKSSDWSLTADRECDPDLCTSCQWSICKEKPPGSMDCHNMKLRLRQHKRVAMGLSQVAGWGAFAQVGSTPGRLG